MSTKIETPKNIENYGWSFRMVMDERRGWMASPCGRTIPEGTLVKHILSQTIGFVVKQQPNVMMPKVCIRFGDGSELWEDPEELEVVRAKCKLADAELILDSEEGMERRMQREQRLLRVHDSLYNTMDSWERAMRRKLDVMMEGTPDCSLHNTAKLKVIAKWLSEQL